MKGFGRRNTASMQPPEGLGTGRLWAELFDLGLTSYPFKKYSIGFNDIATVIGNDDKVKYFEKDHNVRSHISNDYGHTMILTIYGLQHDVDIDLIGTIVSHFAPSLKPI
ncbi:unnamed protein product [Adineta ricciae]|uniref:Uncharacterized protein n=1 Tax=Adineta ricciae TaxID=249248 RepID=A0A815KSU7_ADIRI|nr:unnamed protein product [Adineta ricciae]CAF1638173.1 unnamed protein product [Adineta ricciae]